LLIAAGRLFVASLRRLKQPTPAAVRGDELMRRLILVIMCAAMVAASCGGDDGDSSSEATSTTVSTPSDGDADEDASIVEDAVLQLSDLPAGWREETDDEEDGAGDFDVAECGEIQAASDAVDAAETASEHSGPFVNSEAEIESEVGAASTEETVTKFFEEFDDTQQANNCLKGVFTKAIADVAEPGSNVEVGDIRVGRTSLGDFGDETISYQAEVEVKSQGLSVSAYADFVLVRVGRYAAVFSFLDVPSPVETELAQDAISAVVDRLEKAVE
jgi:hypothetical protein